MSQRNSGETFGSYAKPPSFSNPVAGRWVENLKPSPDFFRTFCSQPGGRHCFWFVKNQIHHPPPWPFTNTQTMHPYAVHLQESFLHHSILLRPKQFQFSTYLYLAFYNQHICGFDHFYSDYYPVVLSHQEHAARRVSRTWLSILPGNCWLRY